MTRLVSISVRSLAGDVVVVPPTPGTGGGLPEAPNDGQFYARRNRAWAALGEGGETPSTMAWGNLTGTLSAQGDLAAALAAKASAVDGVTGAERAKLAGIAANATQNSSDAALRARASHTGTQDWSTVTGAPTTLAGYGITDAATAAQGALAVALAAAFEGLAPVAFSGSYADLTGRPTTWAWASITGRPTTLGGYGITDAATAAQGALAASAVQPGALSAVATSGAYADLSGRPSTWAWGSITGRPTTLGGYGITDAATAAQGALAATAVQPGALAAVAISGSYADLTGRPSLSTVALSGAYADLTGRPTLGTAAAAASTDFATAAQGVKADAALPSATAAATYETITNVALKAPLASPAFTGNPTLPTQAFGNATTRAASTEFVQAAVGRIVINSQSGAYTAVLADAGAALLHPSGDATARVFTVPSNAAVPYPIGTVLTVINQNGAGVITIGITADTMRMAGSGATGSRTLAANGIATLTKLTATEWLIAGTGLT